MLKKLFPRNNIQEVALFFNDETSEFVRCSEYNSESGQYENKITFKNPLEAWTSYVDKLDAIVRRQIMIKYSKEELGLLCEDDTEFTEEEQQEERLLNQNEQLVEKIEQINVAEIFQKAEEAGIYAANI